MKIAQKVIYDGRVQGVGFRFTTRQIARGYEVLGWIRNLDDGRVEMLAAGEEQEVADFLTAITQGPLGSNIRHTEKETVDVPEELAGFVIKS